MSIPISQLPEVSTISNEAVFPLVDNDETVKITMENLLSELLLSAGIADYVTNVVMANSNVKILETQNTQTAGWVIERWLSNKIIARTQIEVAHNDTYFKYGSGCIYQALDIEIPFTLPNTYYQVYATVTAEGQGVIASVESKADSKLVLDVAFTANTSGISPGGYAGKQEFTVDLMIVRRI